MSSPSAARTRPSIASCISTLRRTTARRRACTDTRSAAGTAARSSSTRLGSRRIGSATAPGLPSGAGKRLVERFALNADGGLTYSFELEDPEYLKAASHGRFAVAAIARTSSTSRRRAIATTRSGFWRSSAYAMRHERVPSTTGRAQGAVAPLLDAALLADLAAGGLDVADGAVALASGDRAARVSGQGRCRFCCAGKSGPCAATSKFAFRRCRKRRWPG